MGVINLLPINAPSPTVTKQMRISLYRLTNIVQYCSNVILLLSFATRHHRLTANSKHFLNQTGITWQAQFSYHVKTSHLLEKREFLEFRHEDKEHFHEAIKSGFVSAKRNQVYIRASSLTSPYLTQTPKSLT